MIRSFATSSLLVGALAAVAACGSLPSAPALDEGHSPSVQPQTAEHAGFQVTNDDDRWWRGAWRGPFLAFGDDDDDFRWLWPGRRIVYPGYGQQYGAYYPCPGYGYSFPGIILRGDDDWWDD